MVTTTNVIVRLTKAANGYLWILKFDPRGFVDDRERQEEMLEECSKGIRDFKALNALKSRSGSKLAFETFETSSLYKAA